MIKITNIQTLENKQREIISNLSLEELEVYINKLTETYYSSYLNNDQELYFHTVGQLKELLSIFEFEYPNLNIYINFRLLEAINKLLNINLKNDFKPVNVHEVTIKDITVNEGLQQLLRVFEKSKEQWKKDRENERKVKELEQELERYRS